MPFFATVWWAHWPKSPWSDNVQLLSHHCQFCLWWRKLSFECLVCLPLENRPFIINSSVLLLTWYNLIISMSYPRLCMKYSDHKISGMYMSTPTSSVSVSVELWVFNLTFLEYLDTAPSPKVDAVQKQTGLHTGSLVRCPVHCNPGIIPMHLRDNLVPLSPSFANKVDVNQLAGLSNYA